MKRSWVPILICLSLLAVPAVLRAEPAAPAAVAAPAVAAPQGCDPQPDPLAAFTAAPVSPAAPAVVVNPLAGATPAAFVCCTQADRQACQAECAPCMAFPHCFAAECVCLCSSC